MTKITDKELYSLAEKAAQGAYAPYSGFFVGAALLSADGRVFTGCNIEIASFTPSVCAGHSAFINAITAGNNKFTALALVGGPDDLEFLEFCPPSGVCRQVIQEFCNPETFEIVLARSVNDFSVFTFVDLFPIAFSKKNVIGN